MLYLNLSLIMLYLHRDLPQYGHKQWQPYFGKTFDVYTKLWKFQQQHRFVLCCSLNNKIMETLISIIYFRQILDAKYGLRRWQIGEIASKIGQLYYHY